MNTSDYQKWKLIKELLSVAKRLKRKGYGGVRFVCRNPIWMEEES